PGVLDARLLLEHRVDFQEAVVAWFVVEIEDHLDDAVPLVHRLKERAEPGLALAQRVLGTLARGDVAKRQQDEGISVANQAARIQQEGAAPDVREIALELDDLELIVVRENRLQRRPQAGCFPIVVPEIAQGNTLRLLARSAEQVVESAIGSLNLQAGVEHDKRVDYRIQDRFGVFPLVDSLPEACAESGEIRERKYRAACLPLSYCVGGDTEQKP